MKIRRIYYIVFLILWALLIFYFSGRPGYVSDTDSEVLVERFAEIQKTVNESNTGIKLKYSPIFLVRKTAHIILYGVLTYLFFNVYYTKKNKLIKPFIFSIISAVLYAMSDELHQHFVPGRSGLLWDIEIDSYGIIISAILTLIIYKFISIERRRYFIKRVSEIFIGLILLFPFILLFVIRIIKFETLKKLIFIIKGDIHFIGSNINKVVIINNNYLHENSFHEDIKVLFKLLKKE